MAVAQFHPRHHLLKPVTGHLSRGIPDQTKVSFDMKTLLKLNIPLMSCKQVTI